MAMKSKSRVLDTKGKDLETRRLHSITFNSLSLAISCMLKGPDTPRARPIFRVISLIFSKVSSLMSLSHIGKCDHIVSRYHLALLHKSKPVNRIYITFNQKCNYLGGVTRVASPEWTPAFSTCSDTAMQTTSPPAATASTSISLASMMNLEITTGWSLLSLV